MLSGSSNSQLGQEPIYDAWLAAVMATGLLATQFLVKRAVSIVVLIGVATAA